jgi:heme exporter protein C
MKKLTLVAIAAFTLLYFPATWLALHARVPLEALGEGSRVLYFHVPAAWISVLAFAMAGLYALLYLFRPLAAYEFRFHAAAVLGMFYIVLAVVSGAIWARQTWGSWWSWDPRRRRWPC